MHPIIIHSKQYNITLVTYAHVCSVLLSCQSVRLFVRFSLVSQKCCLSAVYRLDPCECSIRIILSLRKMYTCVEFCIIVCDPCCGGQITFAF